MLRIGTSTVLSTGPFSGNKAALKLPEATFLIDNPAATEDFPDGTPFLASYEPADQFCTIVTNEDLDALERALNHVEKETKVQFEEAGRPEKHVYRCIRKARNRPA